LKKIKIKIVIGNSIKTQNKNSISFVINSTLGGQWHMPPLVSMKFLKNETHNNSH
jgi:hypothetical protein